MRCCFCNLNGVIIHFFACCIIGCNIRSQWVCKLLVKSIYNCVCIKWGSIMKCNILTQMEQHSLSTICLFPTFCQAWNRCSFIVKLQQTVKDLMHCIFINTAGGCCSQWIERFTGHMGNKYQCVIICLYCIFCTGCFIGCFCRSCVFFCLCLRSSSTGCHADCHGQRT